MASRSFILPGERNLFSRIANGDEAAFATVFYHYTARIHPFIQKMTRSEVATEEIVQDVFVAIWRNRDTVVQIENYGSWVFTIALRLTYNYLKAKARERNGKSAGASEQEHTSDTTTEWVDFKDSRERINGIVERLPPQRKLIFRMSREQGLNHDQIARELNLSKSTVKNQIVEALKFIREKLQDSYGTPLTLIAVLIKIHS